MGLKDLDSKLGTTKAAERKDSAPLPDGPYQVKIDKCNLTVTKKQPARDMLALELEIISGPYKGRKLFKNLLLDASASEASLSYLKADLDTIGWTGPVADLEDISKRGQLLDNVLNVNQKTQAGKVDDKGRPRVQLYLNSRVVNGPKKAPVAMNAATVARASAPLTDDEPPF